MRGATVEDEFSITAVAENGCQILITSGELDLHTAIELAEALEHCPNGLPVIAELTGLTFIDSTGVHTLLRNHAHVKAAALVSAPGSNVQRVLDLVGANQTIPIYDRVSAAIQAVTAQN